MPKEKTTNGERLSVIETKLDMMLTKIDEHVSHSEDKFRSIDLEKADRREVMALQVSLNEVRQWIIRTFLFLAASAIAIVAWGIRVFGVARGWW